MSGAAPAIPLPPFAFQTLVCGAGGEPLFEEVGRGLVSAMRSCTMLSPGVDLLDVGCGCGRVARFIIDEPIGTYTGFDRHPGMIAWCNAWLAPIDRRLQFHHVAVTSAYDRWDGHAGHIDAAAADFPFPACAFDSILLASVFTHMAGPDVQRYLAEMKRVLRPTGTVLLSVFFSRGNPFGRDEINFFHAPDEFNGLLTQAGFAGRPMAPQYHYDYEQNWYTLTHAR